MVSPVDKSNSFLDSVLNRVENVKKTASRQTYGGNPYLNSG